jgi:hypothetical protein
MSEKKRVLDMLEWKKTRLDEQQRTSERQQKRFDA